MLSLEPQCVFHREPLFEMSCLPRVGSSPTQGSLEFPLLFLPDFACGLIATHAPCNTPWTHTCTSISPNNVRMSAGVQAAQASVGARGKDHRETRAAAEVGAGEEEETETSGTAIY